MRDRIVEILWDNCHDGGNGQKIHEAVEEIIAALPDMIAPLDWEGEDGNPTCEDAQGVGMFYRVLHRLDDIGLLRINGSRNGETVHITVDAAKAAANTHHRAAIMAAFGGDL